MDQKAERAEKLKKFRDLCLSCGFQELAPHVYELKTKGTKTLTFSALIHGNEIGGLEILIDTVKLIQAKKIIPQSHLRLIIGNKSAYFQDVRYVETDMNRSFGLDKHDNEEELRAKELEPFILSSNIFLDFHQTVGPCSTGFFIFEYSDKSYDLARHLHPTLPIVTHNKKRAFKGQTSTAFTKTAGIMGVTIETGQKGHDDAQTALGMQLAIQALKTNFEEALPTAKVSHTFTFHQIVLNPDGEMEMAKRFYNFDAVKKGEVLAKDSKHEVSSETDGVILFPKYGDYARKTPELALVLKPVQARNEISRN